MTKNPKLACVNHSECGSLSLSGRRDWWKAIVLIRAWLQKSSRASMAIIFLSIGSRTVCWQWLVSDSLHAAEHSGGRRIRAETTGGLLSSAADDNGRDRLRRNTSDIDHTSDSTKHRQRRFGARSSSSRSSVGGHRERTPQSECSHVGVSRGACSD